MCRSRCFCPTRRATTAASSSSKAQRARKPFKLDAGALIAYPATSLHRVGAVTRGARLAAVGWARSFVRDPAQRELLFDLDTARRQLFAREGKSAEFDLISKSFANLLRMWAED